jgi:hypothetical protein
MVTATKFLALVFDLPESDIELAITDTDSFVGFGHTKYHDGFVVPFGDGFCAVGPYGRIDAKALAERVQYALDSTGATA